MEGKIITIDPHKALFLPYGVGCVLVRDGGALRRAHQVDAGYLRDLQVGEESLSFTDLSPELTRPFRGLQLWLPIQLHGLGAFREALREKLRLAREAAARIERCANLELADRPQLSTVAFRLRDRDNHAQSELLQQVNARGRVFLSSTIIEGRVVLRICVLSFRTHADRMEDALTAIEQAARTI
jgi:aromatic-L-amino-acid/L-tryptophan decarboxylase